MRFLFSVGGILHLHLVATWAFALALHFATAQDINKAEYFFDVDPGRGNGTPITIVPGNPITFTTSIDASGLLPGYHMLFVRTRSSDRLWSLYEPVEFLIQQSITKAEYFFDTDPGRGLGTPIPITPILDAGTFTATVDASSVSQGFHFLFIRLRDGSRRWSLYEPKLFLVRQYITGAEYFFDTDPGIGLATPLPVTPTPDEITFSSTIATTGLTPGFHVLFVRTKGNRGRWSMSEPMAFFIEVFVQNAEYFIDTDPGVGNGIPLTIGSPSSDISITPTIPTGALADGVHYLFVRTEDRQNRWSLYEPVAFTVDSALPIELISFSAQRKNADVELSWTTASEVNCDFFEVQRMTNTDDVPEKTFAVIGKVGGNGTTTLTHHYKFVDVRPEYSPMKYYRLKQVDFDGRVTYSPIASVKFDAAGSIIKIYPNPGSEIFTLEFEGDLKDILLVELSDLEGKTIQTFERVSQTMTFGKDLAAGVYLLRVLKQSGAMTFKLVKAK